MQNALQEPMIAVESVMEDDRNQEEYSEWKLLIGVVTKSSVNSSYQNRDFRKKDGTPVIDPETYRKLQDEVTAISNSVMQKHVALYLVLVFTIASLPHGGEASVQPAVGAHLLALVLFHLVSHYIIFKKADAELLAIVATYQTHFWETYGVTMGYSKGTKPVRWWSDDSGITLRRPRSRMSEASPLAEGMASDPLNGGRFPAIYIQCDMPGNLHIDETSYDASMQVDMPTWTLLQSTHKEMIQPTPFFRAVFFIFPLAVIAYGVVTIGWVESQPSAINLSLFWGGLVLLIALSIFMIVQEDKHNQRMYQEITQRVNTALQKEEMMTTAGDRLMVEFHSENSQQLEKRRYQFVCQSVGEQNPGEKETVV